MLGLVGTVDKPISVKVVPSRSNLVDIAGNLYGGVSHDWHFQFRHSSHALEGKRRRKTDLISIKMLWRHVWIVYRHSEKNSLRNHILGFGPLDHCLEGSKYSVQFEGIRNPNIGDLPFGNVDQSHWKRGSLSSALMRRLYSSSGKSSLQILLFLISPLFRNCGITAKREVPPR